MAERESDLHPISINKTPAPQHISIDRKKRKWKFVENKKGSSSLGGPQKTLALLLKSSRPTPFNT